MYAVGRISVNCDDGINDDDKEDEEDDYDDSNDNDDDVRRRLTAFHLLLDLISRESVYCGVEFS